MNNRKTKIVCSMGPTSESLDVVCDLLRSGMNVARFNFSHGTHEYHKKNIETVREASRITKIPCAILLDTKGPEIRTGTVVDNGTNCGKIKINTDDIFLMTNDDCLCSEAVYEDGKLISPGKISLSWKKLPEETSIISSISSKPSSFSIFAITLTFELNGSINRRIETTSLAELIKLAAIKSTPILIPNSISFLSCSLKTGISG